MSQSIDRRIFNDRQLQNWKFLLLLILPIVYGIITGGFLINWTPFYITSPDPFYAYLFNGMSLASGRMIIGHVDHPGTPVQCFVAILIYIKHLFNYNTPLYQDVLMHPESYLYMVCVVITLIYISITWFTGYYLFKRTGNIILALVFQAMPIIGKSAIYAQDPTPESFILMGGMFFMAYIYYNSIYTNPQHPGKIALKQIIIYGILTGLLVACKFTCMPLLLIVLFLLPTIPSGIQYTSSFIISFFIFIIPALSHWDYMLHWIYAIATHTGHYGSGDSGIINPTEFLVHLRALFMEDFYFTSVFILLLVALLIAFARRKQTSSKDKIYLRLLCGLVISFFILTLLVAKHYSFKYMLPARICLSLAIVGSYKIFRDVLKIKIFKNRYVPTIICFLFLSLFVSSDLYQSYSYFNKHWTFATANFLNKYPNEPIIINSEYQCARIEPSLDFGVRYTGSLSNKYWEFLKKKYPNSYQYVENRNTITYWDDIFYIPELFAKYDKVLVYFYQKDSIYRDSVLANFCNWDKHIKLGTSQLIYTCKQTNEYVYELTAFLNTSKMLLTNYKQTDFDYDKLTKDKSKFISKNGHDSLGGTNDISNKESHSGNNSILLDKQHQYTPIYKIKALIGNMISIRIWRKSGDDISSIVLNSNTANGFYCAGQAIVDSDANGWKQIAYKCIVPNSVKDSTVIFYLWYHGDGCAYFDDLDIKVYPMRLKKDTIAAYKY